MPNMEIIWVSPQKIILSYTNPDEFNDELKIGTYVKIPDQASGNKEIIGIVSNYHIQYSEKIISVEDHQISKSFIIEVDLLGMIESNNFVRWAHGITIPPQDNVSIAKSQDLQKIYNVEKNKVFSFWNLSQNTDVRVNIDWNKFFNKHFAIVWSTWSGKSHTVAKILQNAMNEKNEWDFTLNNSHIILFDIHGEYKDCFGEKANNIDITNLKLPYWLLNSEELEDFFLDTKESNAHNQISQFVRWVTKNKQLHNSSDPNIHFNSPVFFDINEVFNYIRNLNFSTKEANTWKLAIETREWEVDTDIENRLFKINVVFKQKKTWEINAGQFAWEFDRFVIRFENKLNDNRLNFILGQEASLISFQDAIKQFIWYNAQKNITVIDLSGIPSEVLNIVVSLISRLLFQYGYYHKKYLKEQQRDIEVPLVLVYEEAHKYIPKTWWTKYRSVKESIERIAKEGRKYGVTLGIVSQRPSEISETIFSQCNNFIAMRLTNPDDQNYIKRLLPDTLGNMIDILPLLSVWEWLIMGDSINMPSLIKVDLCDVKPNSNDVKYLEIWKEEWKNVDFEALEAVWKS